MTLAPSAQRVQDELARLGSSAVVRQLDRPTRSAGEAAAAVGCHLAQIAKSLVFRGSTSGRPFLIITSGANRVDEAAVAERIGERLERAEADFVRAATGYAIGGVPPLAHASPLATFIDEDLLANPTIWCAGGTPNALFEIASSELVRLSGAVPLKVKP